MLAFRAWSLDAGAVELTGEGLRWTAARGAPTRGPLHVRLEDARLVECAALEERAAPWTALVAVGVVGGAMLFAGSAAP